MPDYIKILKIIGGNKDLVTYYKQIFSLKRYGGFDLNEINNMYPYEMEIYSLQTIHALEEERKNNEKR